MACHKDTVILNIAFISLPFEWICISTNGERIHNNDNSFHKLYDILNKATAFRKKLRKHFQICNNINNY